MNGAQMVNTVTEMIFTTPEDSILITLCSGRLLELFGDGYVQERQQADSPDQLSTAIVEFPI